MHADTELGPNRRSWRRIKELRGFSDPFAVYETGRVLRMMGYISDEYASPLSAAAALCLWLLPRYYILRYVVSGSRLVRRVPVCLWSGQRWSALWIEHHLICYNCRHPHSSLVRRTLGHGYINEPPLAAT